MALEYVRLLRSLASLVSLSLCGCKHDWSLHSRDSGLDASDNAQSSDAPDDDTTDDAAAHQDGNMGSREPAEPDGGARFDATTETPPPDEPDGQIDLDAASDGCASDTDPENCGSCGYACEPGLACSQGGCEQPIRELVLGGSKSCALFGSATGAYGLQCWGDSAFATFRDSGEDATRPRTVVGVPAVRALALSRERQCAILPDQDVVRCWGSCAVGCGLTQTNATTDGSFADVVARGVVKVSMASVGGIIGNTCALTGGGEVSCWGSAAMITDEIDRLDPIRVNVAGDTRRRFSDLSGGGVTCAVVADKRVACWGGPGAGGNGLGVPDSSLSNQPPIPGVFVTTDGVAQLGGANDVEVGGNASCIITDQGDLWCWGKGTPGAVKLVLSNVVDVALGLGHTCAIANKGQVYCWGTNTQVGLGPLAVGDTGDGATFSSPQSVPGVADAIEIQAGYYHTCARRRSGQVVCWGANDQGQLGDGTKIDRLSPTPVVGLY